MPGAYWRKDYDEFEMLLQFSQDGRAFADIGEVDDWKDFWTGPKTSLLRCSSRPMHLDHAAVLRE
jgi:hypothetical protein